MPSRRISADDSLAPVQELAVNPYSAYNSDNVNMLTRIVSGERHKDFVVNGLDLFGINRVDNEVLDSPTDVAGDFPSQVSFDANWNGTSFDWDTITDSAIGIIPAPDKSINAILQSTVAMSALNVGSWYKITFDLTNVPKRLHIQIGSESFSYDHPAAGSYVLYLQLNNENGVLDPLTFTAVLDDLDAYSNHLVYLDNVTLTKVLTRGSDIEPIAIPYDANNMASLDDADIPEHLLHPHESVKVMPGIAIKDEAMLNILGTNPSDDPAITLTYSDPDSWVHADPFEVADFTGTANIFTDGDVLTATYASGLLNSDKYAPLDDGESDGVHDGSDNAAVLIDSTKAWGINDLVGATIYNLSDGSKSEITANTATTITGVLSGGTDNDWDINDSYSMIRKVAGDEGSVQWAYICIYYSYFKNPEANKAYVGLVREANINDATYGEDYLILGKCRFIDIDTVDAIIYYPSRQDWGFIDAANVTYLKLNQLKHWANKPLNASLALDLLADRIYNFKGMLYFQRHEDFRDWIEPVDTDGKYILSDGEGTGIMGTGHGPSDYLQWTNGMDTENGNDLVAFVLETNSFWRSQVMPTGIMTETSIERTGVALSNGTVTLNVIGENNGETTATVDITVAGGIITTAAINNAGTGYIDTGYVDLISISGSATTTGVVSVRPDAATFSNYNTRILWTEIQQKRFELDWSGINGGAWPSDVTVLNWSYKDADGTFDSSPVHRTHQQARDAWPAAYYVEEAAGIGGSYTIANPFNPQGLGMVPGPAEDDVVENKFLRADGTWQPADSSYRFYLHGWPQVDMIVGRIVATSARLFSNLYWHVDYSPASDDLEFEIYKGVSPPVKQGSTYSIGTGVGNDATGTIDIDDFSVVAGDVIMIKITQIGTVPNEGGNDLTISLY